MHHLTSIVQRYAQKPIAITSNAREQTNKASELAFFMQRYTQNPIAIASDAHQCTKEASSLAL